MAPVILTPTLTGPPFKQSLIEHLRGVADLAERTEDSLTAKTAASTLRNLADHVQGLDPADLHLAALAEASGELNPDGRRTFAPGSKAQQFIARAGRDLKSPPSEQLLIELITVEVMDACSALRERHAATLDQETARLRAEVEAERDRKVAAAQDAQQSALDKFHGAEAALADARDKIEHLSAVVGNDDEPASEKPEPKKPSAKKKPTPAKAAA